MRSQESEVVNFSGCADWDAAWKKRKRNMWDSAGDDYKTKARIISVTAKSFGTSRFVPQTDIVHGFPNPCGDSDPTFRTSALKIAGSYSKAAACDFFQVTFIQINKDQEAESMNQWINSSVNQ